MKYIAYRDQTAFLCKQCRVLWLEDELYEYFNDNEDSVLTAISFDQCPRCTIDLHPDFRFQ